MNNFKAELRKTYRKTRLDYYNSHISQLNPQEYTDFYTYYLLKILEILKNHPSAINIAGFYPIKQEPDCLFILKKLMLLSYEASLPYIGKKTTETPMVFRRYDGEKTILTKDSYGIFAPIEENIVEPKVLLVPLLAFDEKMGRLGYGGGFYDRFLEKYKGKNVVSIGLGFECLKSERIPMGKEDVRMSFVVTEKKVYW